MATVTYDRVRTLRRFHRRRNMNYPVLADPESRVIRGFNLFDMRYAPGNFAYGVAHPIIVVMNNQGIVTHRFSDRRYWERPSLDAVLSHLRRNPAG